MSSQKVSQNMRQMLLETTKLKPRRGINWKISDVQVYKRPVIICKFFFLLFKYLSKGGKIAAKKMEHIAKLPSMKMHLADVPLTVNQNMRQKLLEIKTKNKEN